MKKMRIERILFLLLIASAITYATEISTCTVLNIANENYLLTSNVSASGSSNCFTFTNNNMTLDCNGYYVTTNTGAGAVINGGVTEKIKNCNFNSSVNGEDISITITSTSNCDVNITNTTGTLGYPTAFYNSSVNVSNSIFSDLWVCGGNNSNLTGTKVFSLNETSTDVAPNNVFIYFSDNVTFDSINFTGAKSTYLYYSPGVVVKNSYIFAGDIQHLDIDLNSPFTSFFNNTLVSAFAEFLMNNGTIENNSFLYSDMPVNPDSAIYISGSNNTITNNIIDKTSDFSLSGNNSAITRNNFTDNSQLSVQGYNNVIYGNIMNGSDFQQALANFAYLHIQTSSGNNTIHDNNLTSIRLGIEGDNNIIYNNILNVTYDGNPMWSGIYTNGNGNVFYNNYFGHIRSDFLGANYWNTTKQAGTRIYSAGTQIGGNYWADLGGGYSETCTDSDTDGFCDTSYINGSLGTITDYLPLSNFYILQNPGAGGQPLGCFDGTALGDCSKAYPCEKCTITGLINDSSCCKPPVCGDGVCNGAESVGSCPTDCKSISETVVKDVVKYLTDIRLFFGIKYTLLLLIVLLLLLGSMYEFHNGRQQTGGAMLLAAAFLTLLAWNSIYLWG